MGPEKQISLIFDFIFDFLDINTKKNAKSVQPLSTARHDCHARRHPHRRRVLRRLPHRRRAERAPRARAAQRAQRAQRTQRTLTTPLPTHHLPKWFHDASSTDTEGSSTKAAVSKLDTNDPRWSKTKHLHDEYKTEAKKHLDKVLEFSPTIAPLLG